MLYALWLSSHVFFSNLVTSVKSKTSCSFSFLPHWKKKSNSFVRSVMIKLLKEVSLIQLKHYPWLFFPLLSEKRPAPFQDSHSSKQKRGVQITQMSLSSGISGFQ
ncbi:hypothetical protein NXS19_007337 [Fusarium pseudograminearum]|nr:hypothetical protein NXS19_007337 [Fusarium pseudograminearum]